jgi:hypothetical protein
LEVSDIGSADITVGEDLDTAELCGTHQKLTALPWFLNVWIYESQQSHGRPLTIYTNEVYIPAKGERDGAKKAAKGSGFDEFLRSLLMHLLLRGFLRAFAPSRSPPRYAF